MCQVLNPYPKDEPDKKIPKDKDDDNNTNMTNKSPFENSSATEIAKRIHGKI